MRTSSNPEAHPLIKDSSLLYFTISNSFCNKSLPKTFALTDFTKLPVPGSWPLRNVSHQTIHKFLHSGLSKPPAQSSLQNGIASCTHRCGVGCVAAHGLAVWSVGHSMNICRASPQCEHGCAGPVDGWTRTTWDIAGTGVASPRCDGHQQLLEHASASLICAWRSVQGQDHFLITTASCVENYILLLRLIVIFCGLYLLYVALKCTALPLEESWKNTCLPRY